MKKKYIKPACSKFSLITEGKLMAGSTYVISTIDHNSTPTNVPGISGGNLFNSKPATANRIGF